MKKLMLFALVSAFTLGSSYAQDHKAPPPPPPQNRPEPLAKPNSGPVSVQGKENVPAPVEKVDKHHPVSNTSGNIPNGKHHKMPPPPASQQANMPKPGKH